MWSRCTHGTMLSSTRKVAESSDSKACSGGPTPCNGVKVPILITASMPNVFAPRGTWGTWPLSKSRRPRFGRSTPTSCGSLQLSFQINVSLCPLLLCMTLHAGRWMLKLNEVLDCLLPFSDLAPQRLRQVFLKPLQGTAKCPEISTAGM